MARKDILVSKIATAQSLSASFISPVTVIKFLDNQSYQINIITTNSTGTFAVQVSDDYNLSEPGTAVTNPGQWAALDIGGTPFAAGANDTIVIDLNQLPYGAMRLVYTSTVAGTGTADIYLTSKQLGG